VFDIDAPILESMLQLETAAADIFQVVAEQSDGRVRYNLRAGFIHLLLVDQHFSRENESACSLSRSCESAIHQKFVESQFQVWVGKRNLK